MTTPHSNDPNTRIRRGLNTLREMNAGRIPVDRVCRCAKKESGKGPRDSSDKRLERNSNALSDVTLRTDASLISRIPDGETRTRVATTSIATGGTSAVGAVDITACANPVSTQMQWTFPNPHAVCPCLAGLVVDMDWDAVSASWRGTASGCLGDIFLVMKDDPAFGLLAGASGTSYATLDDITKMESVSVACATFAATGNITSDQLTICGVVAANSIPVNITER